MIVLAPTLITKPQSPFSNLFRKVPSKLMMQKKHPTLRGWEKVVTKYHPIVSVIVKKPTSCKFTMYVFMSITCHII
jgi:hypothetical protein